MAGWFLLIPPEGGARQAATSLLNALQNNIPVNSFHFFDCKKYISAFSTLLKKPDDDMVVDLLNHSLIVQCLQYEITHLLVPALCPIPLFTLNLLKKQNITTIHWFIEDFQRATYWKEVIPGYSWFLAVQKGPIREICEKNGCTFSYLPTAASDESLRFKQQNSDSKADVSFVGFPSAYRIDFLEFLLSRNISLAIAGEGWSTYKGPLADSIVAGTWIDFKQSAQIMNTTSMALNLSYNEPAGDLLDIQLSPRVYDILSIGSILLTEDVPLLHETLGDCHFYAFKNREEAVEKINLILSELEHDREDIEEKTEKNRRIILQKHTWEKRAEQIIELCS
jgi:hypothetical protein